MKILITAYNVSGSARGGGSSRFIKTLANALDNVTLSSWPYAGGRDDYGIVIASHHDVSFYNAYKIFISHGIVDAEKPIPGMDKYISVSEEVRDYWQVDSEVINQPIEIREKETPNDKLKNILIITKERKGSDPFMFLAAEYNLKYSDINTPIEEQIGWADLCITLGRGALESMAQGKSVIVADNRAYIGALGDGYLTKDNISEIAKCNFSGRRFKHEITKDWLRGELGKYNANDSDFLYEYVKENHDAKKRAKEIINGFNNCTGAESARNDEGVSRICQSEYEGIRAYYY